MSMNLRTAGKWGSIFVILALMVTLLKQIIAFIGFLTFAVKILIVVVFAVMIIGVGLMVLRTWKNKNNPKS